MKRFFINIHQQFLMKKLIVFIPYCQILYVYSCQFCSTWYICWYVFVIICSLIFENPCVQDFINKSHLEAFIPGQQSLIMMTSNSQWLRIYQNIKGCSLIQATLLKTGERTLYHHRCLELLWNVESHGGIHGKNNEKIAARKRNKLYQLKSNA